MNFSPEEQLILLMARTTHPFYNKNQIQKILSSIDWTKIITLAEIHGTGGLLYQHARTLDFQIPVKTMNILKRMYLQTVGRNMILFNELERVLSQFKKAHIDVICLKGSCLAAMVYPNIGFRQLRDIDLLIKADHLNKVRKSLPALQYRPLDVYPSQWHKKWWAHICEDAQIRFANWEKKVMLETHWHICHLSAPFQINIDQFWERAQPATIAHIKTQMFCPEDLLHHLCIHAYTHTMKKKFRLKWYCDIAEVSKKYQIDWDCILTQMHTYETENPVLHSLTFAHNYLGAFIPDHILDKRTNIKTSAFNISPQSKKNSNTDLHFERVDRVPGILNKLQILAGEICPSRAYMKEYHGQGIALYVVRFGKALLEAAKFLIHKKLFPYIKKN